VQEVNRARAAVLPGSLGPHPLTSVALAELGVVPDLAAADSGAATAVTHPQLVRAQPVSEPTARRTRPLKQCLRATLAKAAAVVVVAAVVRPAALVLVVPAGKTAK